MLDGPYTDLSVSSLSLDQSNRSDTANGKIAPAMLLPLMANWTVSCWILEMPKTCVYLASWGKSTTGTILHSTNRIWLKAK